jgi:nucleotide-binding universal stress UspA family protein
VAEVEAVFRILAALDLGDLSDAVLERAPDAAARHERPEVHVLHAVAISRRALPAAGTDAIARAGAALDDLLADKLAAFGHRIDHPGGSRAFARVRAGRPDEEIVALAAEVDADLIVLGQHRGRRRHWLLGAVPEGVLWQAGCSVLVVQPGGHRRPAADEEQCADCSATRRDSAGERWFCGGHTRGWAARVTVLGAGRP